MQHILTFQNHPTSLEQHWYTILTQIIKGTVREHLDQWRSYSTRGHQPPSNYEVDISMNLQEWASKSTEVMKTAPKGERASGNSIKVLGLIWNFHKDIIHIWNKIRQLNQATKSQILTSTADVFDSVGLFTPVTLPAKLLLQELWEENKV